MIVVITGSARPGGWWVVHSCCRTMGFITAVSAVTVSLICPQIQDIVRRRSVLVCPGWQRDHCRDMNLTVDYHLFIILGLFTLIILALTFIIGKF